MSDPYCTPDEVRHVLAAGADEIDTAETAASLGDSALAGAIEDAQNEVDGKLAARYSGIPFVAADVPPIVKSITMNIAAYLATLTFRRTLDMTDQDPVSLRYARAEANLTAIVKGQMDLPVSPPTPDPVVDLGIVGGVRRYTGDLFSASDFDLTTRWPGRRRF